MPVANDAFSTPTGELSRPGGVIAYVKVWPLGAAAYTKSVQGITGAAAAIRSGDLIRRAYLGAVSDRSSS